VSLGVFTADEARQWEAGFEACTKIEHMEELVDIIDNFIDSGLEVMDKIDTVLTGDAFTSTERIQWRSEAEWLTFRGMQLLLDRLFEISSSAEQLRHQLVSFLAASRYITHERAEELWGKFHTAEVEQKPKVLDDAVQLELSSMTDYQRLSRATQARIRQLISEGSFSNAETALGTALPKAINLSEYTALRRELDEARIQETRQTIRQAAA